MEQRQQQHSHPGATVWLSGLSGAGKSTIADGVADLLRRRGRRAAVLDGDEMRRRLSPELGFSKEDRDVNVRRIGFVARMLAENGVLSLVPVIAPYAVSRDAVRAEHLEHGLEYLEVHIAAPVEVCAARDVKGLYRKQASGLLSGLTGVDDPYEPPVDPRLRLDTDQYSVAECVERLYTVLAEANLVCDRCAHEDFPEDTA